MMIKENAQDVRFIFLKHYYPIDTEFPNACGLPSLERTVPIPPVFHTAG